MTDATGSRDSADGFGIIGSEFIFERGPFEQCHASTIVETRDGLAAAWFGGTAEKNPDVGIWISRFKGERWSIPAEVANGVDASGTRFPCWNPVLFQGAGGSLLLFYKVGPSPSTWWGMTMTSADGGESWGQPRRLPPGILGPIKNKPVLVPTGEILSPSSREDGGWRVHFERSSDGGQTWEATSALNDPRKIGAIQPSILLLRGGGLLAVGRTQQGRMFATGSSDAGRTWGEMTLTELPNPNSGTDAVTLRDGRHLLVYNHTRAGRSPLNVAISGDGRQWSPVVALETSAGEYSYPAVIQAADGRVHITYTWNRTRIKHVAMRLEAGM